MLGKESRNGERHPLCVRRPFGGGAFFCPELRQRRLAGGPPLVPSSRPVEMDFTPRIAAIDWDAMWAHQTALAARKWGGEDALCERAGSSPRGIETSDYADQLLSRMEIRWTHSVLDIGCGNGAIAAAIARRARSVTALDSDPRMLAAVTRRAVNEGISNLRFVQARWETAEIGRDIEPHDVVLASRFFPLPVLRPFLEWMNRAARELCYLTWIVGEREEDRVISRILGTEYHPLPEYGIIYNLLYTMGLHPRVDIFESRGVQSFESIEDAVHDLARGYGAAMASRGKRAEIESWIAGRLQKQGDRFQRPIVSRWALIWWGKDE